MIEPIGRANWWRAVVVVMGCALVAAGAVAVAAEERKPEATIEFGEGSVAAGTGYTFEKGWLVYRGDRHPFRISGLTAGKVGGEKVHARGEVYNLRSVANFPGTYTGAGTGTTPGGDFDVEVMHNRNGVEVKVVSTTKGANLRAAPLGVTITLESNN
jgi:hypothetical protein